MSQNLYNLTGPVALARHGLRAMALAAGVLGAAVSTAQSPRDSQTLPPVEVSGQASEIETLGHVERINTARARARALELTDLLDQQAGLQVRRSGGFGSFATVSARGASAQQTTLTLNGLPLAPTISGDFNLGALSLKQIDHIDLYAGYAPIEFAAAGPGGVIDLRTDPEGWMPSGYASTGSASTWQAGARTSLEHGLARHGFSLGVAASDNDYSIRNPNRAFDPSDPDRRREEPRRNADVRRVHGLYVGRWGADDGPRMDSLIQLQDQDQGIPDARNSSLARTRLGSQQANLQTRIRWSEPGVWPLGVTTRGFWQASRLRYDDRQDQVGISAQLTDTRQHHYGADLLARTELTPALHWSGLARLSRETYRTTDLLRNRQDSGARQHAQLATELHWERDSALRSSATLRHQAVEDRFAAQRHQRETATTWQLAAQWSPTPSWQLHVNGGRSIRPPTFFERFGDRGLFIGNSTLRPESGRNLNLGLGWVHLPWRASIEAYASLLDDAIVTQFDVLSGIGRAENADSARVWGAEARLTGTWGLGPAGRLNLVLRAAAQNTENTSAGVLNGKQLPGRFRQKGFSSLTWLLPRDYELFYEVLVERGRFYDSLNSRPAPDVQVHDVGLRKVLPLGRYRLDLGGEIRNLTDQRGQDFSAQPQPGRQFFVSLEWVLAPTPHHGMDS